MSRYDYTRARALVDQDEPFYALIMAAIMRADTFNATRLRAAFPAVYAECDARYNAPGALLPGEDGLAELDRERELLGLPPAGKVTT